MSIISLLDNKTSQLKSGELESLIAICKSDSQIHGIKLREAHYNLGKIMAKRIFNDLSAIDITVIIMMRAGLCFGLGIADELEILGVKISVLFYYNEEQWNKEKVNLRQAQNNYIILTDAVINTGNNILQIAKSIKSNKNIFFVSNVLSDKAVAKFKDENLYTTRISEKNYTGSKISIIKNGKGPDTGDRLFTQYELNTPPERYE